jgi:multiple sugar transport system permease protein
MLHLRLTKSRLDFIKGMLFISPWLLGFLGFSLYPVLASFFYSFTRYDIIRGAKFVGLNNYKELFLVDDMMPIVTRNTFWWALIAVPLGVVTAFLFANLLNTDVRYRPFFRAIFFIPSIVPAMVAAPVWNWLLNTQYGLINCFLSSRGMKVIPFLSSPPLAKPTLALIHCWAQGGAMVIFLAALQDVPRSLYEVALVDGANAWQRFWNITVPLCTPAALFLLITGLIGAFQQFTFTWLLTQGGPMKSTEFYSVYLYRNAFVFMKMGYASALAWILFIIVMAVTIGVYLSSGRWVYYAGK